MSDTRQRQSARPPRASRPAPKPTLAIVGAQKGGVGKTTVARLLMHWLDAKRRGHVAFDTEVPFGSLIRFYPHKTELLDISDVAAQMRIFDAVHKDGGGSVFVVDQRAGYLYKMFNMLSDLGLLGAAQEGAFNIIFLHVMGGSLESIREISETLDRFRGARHVVVTNPANGADLTNWEASEVRANFEREGGLEINIPALSKLAYNEIDRCGSTFRQFINNMNRDASEADFSYVLRGYARDWVSKSMAQIDRVRL